MVLLILYYLVLPFLAAALVLRFIRRYGADPSPAEVRQNCASDPVEHKCFRVLEKRPGAGRAMGVAKVGDFDSQDKAVDAAYAGRDRRADPAVSFLVVDEKGDVLQEIG
ncbi:MAG: hypothetical protein HY553_08765 [Elusimicrobia bacterium]|nr:hypothetical protein [Elusimicrobiota bacterium]